MKDRIIEIDNLRVTAGRRTILSLDHLCISAGEVFSVLGPNGAGKSTLLKTCLGVQRPARGKVSVFGKAVGDLAWFALSKLRRRIGYVPQDLASRSEMPLTAREVVAIGRTGIAGLFRPLTRRDWRSVDTWIEQLGLAPLAGRPYGELSGGEQRKVLIARSMVQEPELLMLDEPTAHLDLGWREHIVNTIERLYEQTSLTVVLVCHELEVVPACCRRLALLDAGALIALGSPEEVLTSERIASLYGPGLQIRHVRGRHAVLPAGVCR